jgi:hypothetical protein
MAGHFLGATIDAGFEALNGILRDAAGLRARSG